MPQVPASCSLPPTDVSTNPRPVAATESPSHQHSPPTLQVVETSPNRDTHQPSKYPVYPWCPSPLLEPNVNLSRLSLFDGSKRASTKRGIVLSSCGSTPARANAVHLVSPR